jgi:small subunit ribosomal protein S2
MRFGLAFFIKNVIILPVFVPRICGRRRTQRVPQAYFFKLKSMTVGLVIIYELFIYLTYLIYMNPRIQELFDLGAQFGYSKTRRHPSVVPFIFTLKNRRDIIDLEKTVVQIEEAESFMKEMSEAGKTILFVGTKPEIRESVRITAEAVGMPYVDMRWVGGTLTNFSEIRKRADRMLDLEYKREHKELVFKTKKEGLMIDREIVKLNKNFGGIGQLKRLPDVMFVIDPLAEDIAVTEARLLDIPVVALANTDCNLKKVNYPMVANDTIRPSVDYILDIFKNILKK